jgi:hypothetical protein
MDPDGGNVTQLTFAFGGDVYSWPVWVGGDNNGYIIMTGRVGGDSEEIYLMKADGTSYPAGIINLTNNSAVDSDAAWTPFSTNQPPVAVCKDIRISANESCQATIAASDIDNGSFDPDGGNTSLSVDSTGPFSLGEHPVILTATDDIGATASCTAIVNVADDSNPAISLSDPVCVSEGEKFAKKLTVGVTDNCGVTSTIISKIEVLNNGGNIVTDLDIYSIVGNDIIVYPNGSGWSINVTAIASDSSGNTKITTISKPLSQCRK